MLTSDRPQTYRAAAASDPITRWLLMVAALVVVIVVVGGFVRLSRAGLSIVEWDVVGGVIPPIGQAAWEESFAEYQQTPEYLLINEGMSLGEYQRIFYYEWAHRLIARIAGLLVVLPLLWFMWKGRLTARESLPFWGVAALFGVQGAIGWIMVASGLRDRPVVSHFRLTIHLLAAVLLLGIALWMALDRIRNATPADSRAANNLSTTSRVLSWALMAALLVQLAYGGLVAGLKAGYISNTWPLMFGRFIPSGLLTAYEPWWENLYQSIGSHWIHRWFAFVVALLAIAVIVSTRRDGAGAPVSTALNWLLGTVITQITLGVFVVLLGVPKWFALAHQALGVVMFCILLVVVHAAVPPRAPSPQVVDPRS
ncbi:MAG: COX15/CtaA family protein [Acidimicrobiia bacterium]|nr:COX15/CtaA family protein [Acidimicrobiia bacterium]